jgi:hypothetical protein
VGRADAEGIRVLKTRGPARPGRSGSSIVSVAGAASEIAADGAFERAYLGAQGG